MWSTNILILQTNHHESAVNERNINYKRCAVRSHHSGGDDGDEGLGELPDEAQFEVSDGEEDDDHDAQSQVVLPEAPGGGFYTLILQELFPRTPGHRWATHDVRLVFKLLTSKLIHTITTLVYIVV